MPESTGVSRSSDVASAGMDARIAQLEAKLDALAKQRSGRLGSLALLFSFVATLLALPSAFQSAKDSLLRPKWSTSFQTLDPLLITYVASTNQLRVDITTVALSEGKDEDTISFEGASAVLGKQLTGSFQLDDPQSPVSVGAGGASNVTVKGHALFDNPAAANTLAGDEQPLVLAFKGLEGSVTHRFCFVMTKDDLSKIISGAPSKPVPGDCNEPPASGGGGKGK